MHNEFQRPKRKRIGDTTESLAGGIMLLVAVLGLLAILVLSV